MDARCNVDGAVRPTSDASRLLRWGRSFVALLLLLLPAAAEAQRLPLLAAPTHYRLHFAPDLASESFSGRATIHVRVLKPTGLLVLHAAELRINEARVSSAGHAQRADVTMDGAAETATLRVAQPLQPGPAEIHLEYVGTLNRQLRGFYLSEANARRYAVTQLEATDARRMFPSFDEPGFKATFEISATVDQQDYAISNGPVVAIDPGPAPGKRTIWFGKTAPMSTYLVALAVGDFECVEGKAGDVPLRVCATPGKRAMSQFALEATQALLEYFNTYFAIDYPFTKLDQVAIPDFAAGAMENTGAIFYRESILLVDPNRASLAARKRAALVISHEIAHQWFGNLVTMQWWDDLWLNEGFATWMEAKAVKAWQPAWSIELDELQGVQAAMAIDALPSTRSVRMQAETPDEINELFDPIAYEKGAAILRMIEAYVGEESFRGGINAYLDRHGYDNATAEDFWNVVTAATRQPVDRIMSGFVTQRGIPLVTTEVNCKGGRAEVRLTQQRHLASGPAAAGRPDDQQWTIPVCMRYPENAAADARIRCELLNGKTETFTFDRCPAWLRANAAGHGYYRTLADSADLEVVAKAASTPAERLSLVANETALLRSGHRPAAAYLQLASSIAPNVTTAAVLETLAAGLAFMREYYTSPTVEPALEAWVRSRLAPPEPASGADDPYEAAYLALIGGVGRDPEVLRSAADAVRQYLRGSPSVPGVPGVSPTILNTLVRLAAIGGDRNLFDQYRTRAERATTPEERYRFLYALALFPDPALLREAVEYALSPAVRAQDTGLLIAQILSHPIGRETAWPILKARWDTVAGRVGAFGGTSRIIAALGGFCTATAAEDIGRFFEDRRSGAERTVDQALHRIKTCAAVAPEQAASLAQWLAAATAPHK